MRLFVLFLLSASVATAQVPDALAGRWSGAAIYTSGTPRLIDLEIEKTGPDEIETVLTLPYNGFDRFGFDFVYEPGGPADGALVAGLFGDEMRLLVDLGEGNLRGTVTVGDDTTATVYLQRVLDYGIPSFRLEEVSYRAGRDTIAASLILPEADGPYPVAVLVPGRGYGYGRGEMGSWGTMLARNGIAALAYDARGIGGSTGDDSLTTDADRFEDLHAALDYLQTRPDLLRDQVGVLSYSAGAWITPIVAAERDDIAFWVSMVGPAESLADQQAHAVQAFMRASGQPFTEADYEAAYAYQTRLVELSAQGAPWSAFAPLVAAARSASWGEFADLPDGLYDEQLDYFRRRPGFDNVDALRRLRVPTLALLGGADPVVPADLNAEKYRRYATEAGNDDLTVIVFDGADHSLGRPGAAVGEGAWPAGYTRVWTRPPEVFTRTVAWIQDRVDEAD